MSRRLFLHIALSLASRYRSFTLRSDARGKIRLSTLQKCTAAIRQLAYGGTADMFDEYLHMDETTSLQVLRQFRGGIRAIFGEAYLRKPTVLDCQSLLVMHGREHGFPGMIGSIDCMHWEWRNCPVAWKWQFTTVFKCKHPTMILEAVTNYRLWIWHAYFGVTGSNNDVNILHSSPLFNEQFRGEGPQISFIANDRQYNRSYYLADFIYPWWLIFLKMIRHLVGPKKSWFAQRQESSKKDVERAFGVNDPSAMGHYTVPDTSLARRRCR